jgi:hypothetical protein
MIIINGDERYYEQLDLLFFHLPVPFVKGDIVDFGDDKPRVLTYIPQRDEKNYPEMLLGKNCDGSDMCVAFFYLDEEGLLKENRMPGEWVGETRYYKGELTGQNRFLQHLSEYVKNDDNSVDWIINVYLRYYTQFQSEKIASLFHSESSYFGPLSPGSIYLPLNPAPDWDDELNPAPDGDDE